MGKEISTPIVKTATKSEGKFCFSSPLTGRRWEAKTLEQETSFQLRLGI